MQFDFSVYFWYLYLAWSATVSLPGNLLFLEKHIFRAK